MNAPSPELVTGLDYGYIDQTVRNIRSSLAINEPPEPIEPGPLLSIHMQSNRPDKFSQFLEDLEASIDDPSRIEVVVKIDDTDTAMNELLPRLVANHRFVVKYISTPLKGGFFELWRSMNDMLKICHPHAYFLWNMNDEMAVLNKGWDTALLKYVGLFPDHIFRLRTSLFRFRNYYDFWECGFAPETSAITTKRWIDICGDWNPCLGPDSFNQCVSFYFGYHDRFNKPKLLRDVPIHDILLAGEGAFIGLEGDKLWRRLQGATKAWYRLMSYRIQTEASRRSQKLIAHIWAHENKLERFTLMDDSRYKQIIVCDEYGNKCSDFSYGLPISITLANIWRATHFMYFGGGGPKARGERLLGFCTFLALRYSIFAWTRKLYLWHSQKPILRRLAIYNYSLMFGIWPYFRTSTRLEQSWVFRCMSFLKGRLRALFVRGFNRGIRFHHSVFAFDPLHNSLDWQTIKSLLDKIKWPACYANGKTRITLFKCLLLQHWYHLSGDDLEIALGRDLAFQRFVGLPLNVPLPSLRLIDGFRTLLRDAGIEEPLYKEADLLRNGADLPAEPFISKVA
jgi:hypothetical protein